MRNSIAWMIGVAVWVAHLPGAVGYIHAFGTKPLLLASAGLLLIWRGHSPLRLSVAALRPDVLTEAEGGAWALRE